MTTTAQTERVAALTDKLKADEITPTEKGELRALTGREPSIERTDAHEALERGAERARHEESTRGGSLYDAAAESAEPDELTEWRESNSDR